MTSIQRIKGANGVIIDSNAFLELPKAPTKTTLDPIRNGMIRYNKEWQSFEGAIDIIGSTNAEYRRFVQLDASGKISIANLPESLTAGMTYKGTYNPISDDVDPPSSLSVYDNLPAADSDNSGNYYIIRGIINTATNHLIASNPTSSPVIFTPTNPSGDGDWIQIKYYFSTNTAGVKSVDSAYARIDTSQIPSSGHDGLKSLATDEQLTNPFSGTSSSDDPGLRDGDWIISTGGKWQMLRQNLINMSASSVLYDDSFLISNNRKFTSSINTVQSAIDAIVLEGLRRNGDSMYNDGSIGKGRLAVTYGTAAEPSITFNTNPFDPTSNPGQDPSKWSDNKTGLFHRAGTTGEFSASANAKEVIRLGENELLFYPQVPSATGSNGESKLTEIGFRPPFLKPVDNTKGEDGMLAFSPDFNTLIQKISGKWKRISGSETVTISSLTSWVPASDGINYEMTIPVDEPKSVQVQELISTGSYETVEVENMSIQIDKIILQVPMIPDMRFVGRCIVGV